jgi:hypothetical protein
LDEEAETEKLLKLIGNLIITQSQLQQELNMQQQSKDAYPDGN